jgi:hypothetical protein
LPFSQFAFSQRVMEWVKVLHLLAVLGWMTGIFVAPRGLIFWKREYAATGAFGPAGDLTVRVYRFSLGLGVVAILSGLWLFWWWSFPALGMGEAGCRHPAGGPLRLDGAAGPSRKTRHLRRKRLLAARVQRDQRPWRDRRPLPCGVQALLMCAWQAGVAGCKP